MAATVVWRGRDNPPLPTRRTHRAVSPRGTAFFLRCRKVMDPLVMLNSLEAGVAAISPGWRIVSWSPSAARLTGRPADEVIGSELWTAFPATRRAEIEQALTLVLRDGEPRTVILPGRAAEGGSGDLEIEACRAAEAHLLLLIREAPKVIPDPALAGDPVEDPELRLFGRLFEVLPTPALLLTPEGRIVRGNQGAAGLLGVRAVADLRGRDLSEWVRTQDLAPALVGAASGPQRLTVAIELLKGDSPREAQLTLTATDPETRPSRVLCLASEVSREILLQRRLVQADRLSQLGALVSGVAHELNNPLAAIAAFAELLKENAKAPDVAESAGIIHGEAMRAGRMIQTLLDFARQQPHTLQAVSLPDVVDRVLALQRAALKKARISTTVAFGSQLPSLRGDSRELQQVVLNAVVNARQAIAATGKPGRITLNARPSDGHVVVSVEDTGPGVPPEVLERVFEPFFTTKGEEGTGLGLSISSGLIRAMGGRMWLQNVEGSGARLSFELPIESAAPAAARDSGIQPATHSLAVLIVEDLEPLRRGIALMTERLGHTAFPTSGYAEAHTRLAERSTGIEAILVDVHLEDGHTGFELFDELRREGQGREQLVVFTTGDSISPQTRDQLERADRPVLRKPFSLSDLREILDRFS